MNSLASVAPEVFVLCMACAVLIAAAFEPAAKKGLVTYWLSQITIILTMILLVHGWPAAPEQLFHGMVSHDALGSALKFFICLLTAGVFLFSRDYLEQRQLLQGEYFVLGLFALLGMMVMVSANSFLTVYLGLELLSLCLYSMVAFQRDSEIASEAAMKYFVLGALASGMLLYGISMIYGTTGSIEFVAVAKAVSAAQTPHILFVFGVVFIVVGIAFKLGAVPFHMWIPDVYQGAPTAVTLFISTAPKIAAFGMTIRLLVDGLQGVVGDWHGMLIVLALLSVSLGNVVAIAQDNIKRMLAYSTIAHMGYLLLGVLSGTPTGYAASMFYVITYALMSLGSFGMIIYLGRAGFEADKLNDFKGLSQRSPWFALIMMILMFSLAGVPPFLGFWAKWFVFKEVVAAGFVWLAVLAVVFSIIGAYYYLRLVKLMYFDAPDADADAALSARAPVRWALSINGMALLVLGLAPSSLMNLCLSVLKTHG